LPQQEWNPIWCESRQHWRKSHFILHTHSPRPRVFLIQQLFATCGIGLEWKTSICARCIRVDSGSASSPTWNLRATTANLGSERARFISDVGHRRWELVCIRIPSLNKMKRGVRWDPNEGESDDRYEQGHIDNDLRNWWISCHRYDVTKGTF
jgi:hypothetical protein